MRITINMKSIISCSFGEVIDKITILNIKYKKALDISVRNNVANEISAIERDNPHCKKEDTLFNELKKINEVLWNLEDLIRNKSSKGEFDESYIECAESIHKMNDERYDTKRKINKKYNSEIFEEKIYSNNFHTHNDLSDKQLLEIAKKEYNDGVYLKSFIILSSLVQKYINIRENNQFIIDLRISFDIITDFFDVDSELKKINTEALTMIERNIDNINGSEEFEKFWKQAYHLHCMKNNKYLNSKYYYLYNCVYGPNIQPGQMSFFNKGDTKKTLLLYNGGGLGDMIMYFRFVRSICEIYCKNNIIIIVEDRILWMMKESHNDLENLTLIPSSRKNELPKYDYHCSVHILIKYLKLEYEDIPFTSYLENIETKTIHYNPRVSTNKHIVFNWKGSSAFSQELSNRRIELNQAISLFKIPKISWIVITQDITSEELKILKENHVTVLNKDFDAGENAFEDTVSLFKHVDLVISTDTSLLHLAGTMGVQTVALLTRGCEWRWSKQDETTKWYPNIKLIKQRTQGDWGYVIDELTRFLS